MENQPASGLDDRFEVFFDGECPLCRREIDMLRRKDIHNRIIFTNIAAPDFDPTPYTLQTMMSEIHGRLPGGEFVTGVEVFRQLYRRIGFGGVVSISRWPVIRHFLDVMYSLFARIRYWTAKGRIAKSSCDSGSCPANSSLVMSDSTRVE